VTPRLPGRMIGASMNRSTRGADDKGARFSLMGRFGRRKRGPVPPAPLRVWVLIAGLALTVALAWAAAIDQLADHGIRHPLPWPAVAAAMAGASLLTVTFLVRGQSLNVVPSEIPLVVGVVFLSPVHLLLATVAAEVLSSVAKKRPPRKRYSTS
jgi:hypothetical protein